TFPHGCNTSFITLIPKIQDAKVVKDFRPISLIGSVYKIIAKVLANRMSFVMLELISDMQSAFVANRQILDGPFILNELLSWCKHKKLKTMIFKIDFENAFDSVRWDYLDDVLKAFGFGDKWRSWISGCLKLLRDSMVQMVWISWKKVLTSKQKGGLSLSSLFAINRALMFKWLWRFKTQSPSLWSRVIKAIYGVHGALDTFFRISWSSPWLDILCEVSSLKSKGIDLCALIRKKDRWFWSLEGSSEFLVKSTRILINDFFHHIGDVLTRWVKLVPIKINIFAWRVFLDKLPTRLNLSLRGVDSPSILCPICNVATESSFHLFFTCPLARHVRCKVLHWWELDDHDYCSYDEWLLWFKSIRMSSSLKIVFEGVCYVMWWTFWRFRNRLLFYKSPPRKDTLFDDIVQKSFDWCSSRSTSSFNWVI
ncbi:RNA-directed DNA polymerase, eukaryota, partial [Tanacetum coccineum]